MEVSTQRIHMMIPRDFLGTDGSGAEEVSEIRPVIVQFGTRGLLRMESSVPCDSVIELFCLYWGVSISMVPGAFSMLHCFLKFQPLSQIIFCQILLIIQLAKFKNQLL